MKNFKLLTFLLCMTLISFNEAKAQVDVTVNPVGLLWGSFNGSADFALSENMSVEGQLGVTFGDFGGDKYLGIPITVYGKYYFNPKNGADKFYGDVFTRFVRRSYNPENSDKYSNTRFGLGFGLGYKIVSDGGFVFDIGTGVGRALVNKDSDDLNLESLTNLMFVGKLAIGYRFGG